MRLLRFSLASCIRNRKKALLNLLICIVTVILMNVFAANIVSILSQMKRLPEVIDVTAVVSNLNGSMDAGLEIKEEDLEGILASKYIVDPAYSIKLKFGFGEFGVEDYLGNLNYYSTGSNCVEGIPGLREEEITLQEGITFDEFFGSHDMICIMDQRLMDEKGLKIGDEITLTNFYYRYGQYHDIYIDPLFIDKFKIVGTVNIMDYLGDGVCPDMILPFETIRDVFHELDLVFFTDACSFRVKDPYRLNQLKQEMHDVGFLPVIFQSEFQYHGNALTIKDETFVRSAEQLIKSRNLFLGILPFVGIAVLCIGFVMAELLMKGRTAEYAIMRSLGQNHAESFAMLVIEYGFSALLGSVIGIVISILCLKANWGIAILTALAFMVCYIVGTIAALSSLNKLSVMAVLAKND